VLNMNVLLVSILCAILVVAQAQLNLPMFTLLTVTQNAVRYSLIAGVNALNLTWANNPNSAQNTKTDASGNLKSWYIQAILYLTQNESATFSLTVSWPPTGGATSVSYYLGGQQASVAPLNGSAITATSTPLDTGVSCTVNNVVYNLSAFGYITAGSTFQHIDWTQSYLALVTPNSQATCFNGWGATVGGKRSPSQWTPGVNASPGPSPSHSKRESPTPPSPSSPTPPSPPGRIRRSLRTLPYVWLLSFNTLGSYAKYVSGLAGPAVAFLM